MTDRKNKPLHDTVVDFSGTMCDLEVEYIMSDYVPARLYGPPEDCSPAEGGEVEVGRCWVDECEDGLGRRELSLLPALEETIAGEIFEHHVMDVDGDDWDWDDRSWERD
jgi:hypothetical protein